MATCANHPQNTASVFCRSCGKPICEECKRDVRGVIYCEPCIAARLEGSTPSAGASVPPVPNAESLPNVGLATFLGFIPGVGAMYNGQFKKAFAHIVAFVTLSAAAEHTDIFGLFCAAFFFYMVFDANRTAKARIHGAALPDFLGIGGLVGEDLDATGPKSSVFQKASEQVNAAGQIRTKPPVAAIILIGLGALLLLNNFDLFHFRVSHLIWPIAFIVFGGYLGLRNWNASRCPCVRCGMNCMMWPVLLVTFGVLMLLDSVNAAYFKHTWPIMLVVFGAVRLMQTSAPTAGHIEAGSIPAHEIPPVPPVDGGTGSSNEVNRG